MSNTKHNIVPASAANGIFSINEEPNNTYEKIAKAQTTPETRVLPPEFTLIID